MRPIRVADLKRLPAGTRLRLVENLRGPCDKVRIVSRVTGSAVFLTGPDLPDGQEAWLPLPKLAYLRGDARSFTIIIADGSDRIGAKYVAEEPLY